MAWIVVASTLPALDGFLPMLFYQSKAIGSDYVISLLAGACEAARLIFMLLALKALAAAARDYDASERSGYGVMIVTGIMGGVALITLLVAIILQEGKFKSVNTYANIALLTVFLMYLAYTLMMLSPAFAAMARSLGYGPPGVFLAMAVAFSMMSVVSAWLFARGKWKLKRV